MSKTLWTGVLPGTLGGVFSYTAGGRGAYGLWPATIGYHPPLALA